MKNQKIKNLLLAAVIFCCLASVSVQADTNITTNNDFYYERDTSGTTESMWYYYNTAHVYSNACDCEVGNTHFNRAIPYFNFDFNPYMSAFNNATTVTLNLTTSTAGIQTPTNPKPATFDVFLTDWTSTPSSVNTAKTFDAVPFDRIGDAIGTVTLSTTYGADQSLQISLDKSDIATYLASNSNILKILIDPYQVLTTGQTLTSDFYALPSGSSGQIRLNADVIPIPEPSSIIFSLISLGCMFGARKLKT